MQKEAQSSQTFRSLSSRNFCGIRRAKPWTGTPNHLVSETPVVDIPWGLRGTSGKHSSEVAHSTSQNSSRVYPPHLHAHLARRT